MQWCWPVGLLPVALLLLSQVPSGVNSLSTFLKHFDRQAYEPVLLKSRRRKRGAIETDYPHVVTNVVIRSQNRNLHLKLHRDDSLFNKDHLIDLNGVADFDDEMIHRPRFLYDGFVIGDPGSRAWGSLLDGIFDGYIQLSNGTAIHVEKAIKYYGRHPDDFHSIAYDDSGIRFEKLRVKRRVAPKLEPDLFEDEPPLPSTVTCGMDEKMEKDMLNVQQSAVSTDDEEHSHKLRADDASAPPVDRYKRRVNSANKIIGGKNIYDVRTCSLYMLGDHKLYEQIYKKEGQKVAARTREEVMALFYNHIKAVNHIYEEADFQGIRGINFQIQRTSLYNSSVCNKRGESNDKDYHFCPENVDVSNYLNLNSKANHSAFCLAYAVTYRDFVGGTLGLAWVASPQHNTAGGVCQIYQQYNERSRYMSRSLNTGIVTLVNYGNRVPARVSQLTLAHEIGHNFGSPHDYPAKCQPGLPDGNFIMFSSATSGDKTNNAKFSHCSIGNISAVLKEVLSSEPIDPQHRLRGRPGQKRNCFAARTTSFCGNSIFEGPNEECDCGFTAEDCAIMNDKCCHPHNVPGLGCTRRRGKCSPSEGPCCDGNLCNFKRIDTFVCRESAECTYARKCDGQVAQCLPSDPKPDGTLCQEKTKICDGGVCNASICQRVGLKECFITTGSTDEKCQLACEKNGKCVGSSNLDELKEYYQTDREGKPRNGILLRPGSPCDNYKGYCDIFRKCRSVDSNGPLSRLKRLLFNEKTLLTVWEEIQEHWYIAVLMLIGLVVVMATFIKCCAVHTPSTNPNKPPAHNIYETLRHPSTLMRSPRRRAAGGGADGRARAQPTAAQQPHGGRRRSSGERRRRSRDGGGRRAQPTAPPGEVTSATPAAVIVVEPPPAYSADDPNAVPGIDFQPIAGPPRGHRKHRKKHGPNVELR